jgi:hypothetical protein
MQKMYLSFQMYVVNLLATKEGDSKSKSQRGKGWGSHKGTHSSSATTSTHSEDSQIAEFSSVNEDTGQKKVKEKVVVKVIVKEEKVNDSVYELADDAPPGITGAIARVLSRVLSTSASFAATVDVTDTEDFKTAPPPFVEKTSTTLTSGSELMMTSLSHECLDVTSA